LGSCLRPASPACLLPQGPREPCRRHRRLAERRGHRARDAVRDAGGSRAGSPQGAAPRASSARRASPLSAAPAAASHCVRRAYRGLSARGLPRVLARLVRLRGPLRRAAALDVLAVRAAVELDVLELPFGIAHGVELGALAAAMGRPTARHAAPSCDRGAHVPAVGRRPPANRPGGRARPLGAPAATPGRAAGARAPVLAPARSPSWPRPPRRRCPPSAPPRPTSPCPPPTAAP